MIPYAVIDFGHKGLMCSMFITNDDFASIRIPITHITQAMHLNIGTLHFIQPSLD